MRTCFLIAAITLLAACREDDPQAEAPARGLKTFEVAATERVSVRRFPAVLEASEIAVLSFEVGGKLQEVTLDVGQRIAKGDVLAQLDPVTLQLQVDTAQAAVDQARSTAENAASNAKRQQDLLDKGATTRVSVDDARTQSETANASLAQALKSLENAEQNLEKSVLTAPFDGILNTVEVDSFVTVGVGAPIASLYRSDSFQVSFSVNFDTVNRLVVGKPAQIRLADRPDITLPAVVSEIGSRADSVSSFPIVLELKGSNPILKAGMAVEASIEFPLAAAEGFSIPLSAVIMDGDIGARGGPDTPGELGVYIFDPASSTVKKRTVTVGGVRENALLVIDGLSAGDHVASAGVSFLQDGQTVKLLASGD